MLAVGVAGCVIESYDPPVPAVCELDAPEQVAVGEPFEVVASCDAEIGWYAFDFGDGSEIVRTRDPVAGYAYSADDVQHLFYRVQVFYEDMAGNRGNASVRVSIGYAPGP